MTLRLQIGDEVRPQQTPELILSRRGRAVSSLVTCPVALYTCTREAPGGPEGIGEADQMPGCHGRPVGAMLVRAQPQPWRGVLHP
jgi:hypothetical protein